jgi:hypothetical protein
VRFEQASAARTQAAQSGGAGSAEAADKKAEAASKVGDHAATNLAADTSKVSGEQHRAVTEFRGHLQEGTTNFVNAVDQMVPQVTGGITRRGRPCNAGNNTTASSARSAVSPMIAHAGGQLDHTAAAITAFLAPMDVP